MAKHKRSYDYKFDDEEIMNRLRSYQHLISEDPGLTDMYGVAELMLDMGFTDMEVHKGNHKWEWYREWLEDALDVASKRKKVNLEKEEVVVKHDLITKQNYDYYTVQGKNILFPGDSTFMLHYLKEAKQEVDIIFADYMEEMLIGSKLNVDYIKERLQFMYDVLSKKGMCLVYVPAVCNARFDSLVREIFGGVDAFKVKSKNGSKDGCGKTPDYVYFLTKRMIKTNHMTKCCVLAPLKKTEHVYVKDGPKKYSEVARNSLNTAQTDPLMIEAQRVVDGKMNIDSTHMYTVLARLVADKYELEVVDDFDFEKYNSGCDFDDCWKVSEEEYAKLGKMAFRLHFRNGENLRGCSKNMLNMTKQIKDGTVRLLELHGEKKLIAMHKVTAAFIYNKIEQYVKENELKPKKGDILEFKHDTVYSAHWDHGIEVMFNDTNGVCDADFLNAKGAKATFKNKRSLTFYRNILSWLVATGPISVLDLTAGTGNFERELFSLEDSQATVIACEKDPLTYECLKANMEIYTEGNFVEMEPVELKGIEEYTKEVYRRNLASVILSKMNDRDLTYATSRYVPREIKRIVEKYSKFNIYSTMAVGRKLLADTDLQTVSTDIKNISLV